VLGSFQNCYLRLEVEASARSLATSLLQPEHFRQWLAPQQWDAGLPVRLAPDTRFAARLGPVAIAHRVQVASDRTLRLLLSGAVDGYHEWYWGDGWVQSRLEGISLLPLQALHTVALWRLRAYAEQLERTSAAPSAAEL